MLASRSTSALLKSKASLRWASTAAEKDKYKFVIVGAGECSRICILGGSNGCGLGSGGLTVASQLYNRFRAAGKPLNEGDIAIVDAADYHYYQVRYPLRSLTSRRANERSRPACLVCSLGRLPGRIVHSGCRIGPLSAPD